MWYAAIHSPADGKTNSRFACAKIGAVGIVASTAGAVTSDIGCSCSWTSVSTVTTSSGSCGILAATLAMFAMSPNAPIGTSDNSVQSAASITIVPASSYENFVGFTPTLT